MPNGMSRSRRLSRWRPGHRRIACRPRISSGPMRPLPPSESRSSEVTDWLDWPFFEARHRELAQQLEEWCRRELGELDHSNIDMECVDLAQRLGAEGFLSLCVSLDESKPDARSLRSERRR